MLLVFNMPVFCLCQDYTGFQICLNMRYLSKPQYAKICVNMPKSTCMIYFTFFCCNFWTCSYLFQYCTGTWGCFLEEKEFDFFYSSWKHLIFFCFRPNIWRGNRWARGLEIVNLDIPTKKKLLIRRLLNTEIYLNNMCCIILGKTSL